MDAYKAQYPDAHIEKRDVEYIYLAIVCPVWSRTKFLYNGPLHCQARHSRTGKILWPIIELVSEGLGGEAMGFGESMQDLVKYANGILTHMYHSARTNSGSGTLYKPDMFKGEKEAKNYEKYGSDNTRHFALKIEADGTAVQPIPKGTIAKEHTEVLNVIIPMLEKVSAINGAMKGQVESAQTSGKLNAQRINQSFIQLQEAQANFADFKKRIAEYILAIWVEYNDAYTNENVRLLTKNNADDPDFIVFNQLVEERDEMGTLTGRLVKLNDPTTVQYDIMIEDPYASPMARQQQIDNLMELLNTPAIQADQMMVAGICFELLTLIDIPMEMKVKLQQNSALIKAKQAEKAQMEQAQAQAELQASQAEAQGAQLNNAAQAQAINQQAQMPPELPQE